MTTDGPLATLHTPGGEGPVAVLTLADPQRRNVLSARMVDDVERLVGEAEADPSVRALVVAAEGKAFCAGAQLDTLEGAVEGDFGPIERVYDGFLAVLRSPLLTIAAVDGPAVGAGMNLALACDLRLAGPRARFDTRFLQLRLHPGGGHLWMLERAVGYQRAVAAVLLGQVWDADAAREAGLVLEVADDVVARAVEVCGGLAGADPALVRRILDSARTSYGLGEHADAFALETEAQAWSVTQPAFLDGVRSMRAAIDARR